MAMNNPTYDTNMGMNRGVSNRMRQGAVGQRNNPYGQSYGRGGGTQPIREPVQQQQQYQYNQGQQANPNQFSYYQGLDPTTLQSNAEREAALQAVQANIPISQYNQNAYQYAQDFNEAQRRWNEQFGYQQGLDQFNMGLADRQQTNAEWQAQQAANQWAQDFARQQGNDTWNQQFSQQQFGLQDYSTREGLRQQEAYQQGQLGVQQQANAINQAYNQGRLSNEQRQLALAELTQSQQNTYQNTALAQQAALAREQMAAQQQNAILQAYGRNQRPNSRWVRSF